MCVVRSATVLPAHPRFLEEYKSWSGGRLHAVTFSAERIRGCSLPLFLIVAVVWGVSQSDVAGGVGFFLKI